MRCLFLISAILFGGALSQTATTGPCSGAQFGDYIPDPSSCGKFYQCMSNADFVQECPSGLHFNAKLKVCDWPSRANCLTSNGSNSDSSNPGKSDSGSSSNPDSEVPNSSDPVIPSYPESDNQGNPGPSDDFAVEDSQTPITCTSTSKTSTAAYPGDDSKFYYCYNGHVYIVACNKNQKYSSTENNCVSNSN